MPPGPRIRASDADRDRTASMLREHHAEGRLTAEEFHERLDAALSARTLDELDELTADLPHIDIYKLPDASLRRPPRSRSVLPADGLAGPAATGGESHEDTEDPERPGGGFLRWCRRLRTGA